MKPPPPHRPRTVNWSELEDGYGPADELPQLLNEMTPDANADVWTELWGRLCRQGKIYSASFAALPAIAETAMRWSPRQRLMPLTLSGTIIGLGRHAVWIGTHDEVERALPNFRNATEESLRAGGWNRLDFIYLLTAWVSFAGNASWLVRLEAMANGELPLVCPHCSRSMLVRVGDEGLTASAYEKAGTAAAAAVEITRAAPDSLSGIERQLVEWSRAGKQPAIENSLLQLCGAAECPVCGGSFSVLDAIAPIS